MATPPPPRVPTPPHGRFRVGPLSLLVGALVLAAAVLAFASRRKPESSEPEQPPPAAPSFPITPLSSSEYLNTKPEALYVGSESCRPCHTGRHDSFRTTGMGRSMAAVDLVREPADAAYEHTPSKRRYEVTRKDGQMRHRELLSGASHDVVLSDYPVKYVVGSGRHSLTYLCEIDGFLVESPVTWYTAKRAWGMSPGYDNPGNPGFERATGEGCLQCHAGRAAAVGGSLHRMTVTEAAIGCERCHGPGSLHIAKHGAPGPAPRSSGTDRTIVNPSRLPRDLAESVCQQCHLRPTAVVPARGRAISDFRPGLPLSDVVHAYELQSPDSGMTVVGHVEQMHLSRCYQKSDRLTCLTCHSPHAEPDPARRIEHYRAACLTCHRPAHCKVTPERRQKESPENDCVQCHMPRSPTEIPHLAFTHHRIGLHETSRTAGKVTGTELIPIADLSRFPETDRKRSLGLGYLEAANREANPARVESHRQRAMELLSGERDLGLRDPVLDANLARLRFDMRLPGVLQLAASATAYPTLVGQDRCNGLFLQADAFAQEGRQDEAVPLLRQLTTLRRHPVDWILLAQCERILGRVEWVESLTTATRINPRLWKMHQALDDHFGKQGNSERAAWHRARAVP